MELCLLHWQADALPLNHQGSPYTSHFEIGVAFPFSREESEAQTYEATCARLHNMNINTNTKKKNTAFIRSQAGSIPMALHILTCLYYYEVWNTVILTKDKKI